MEGPCPKHRSPPAWGTPAGLSPPAAGEVAESRPPNRTLLVTSEFRTCSLSSPVVSIGRTFKLTVRLGLAGREKPYVTVVVSAVLDLPLAAIELEFRQIPGTKTQGLC